MNVLHSGGWRGPAVGRIMNTGFDMMTLYFLFVAAGHSVSLEVLLTIFFLYILLRWLFCSRLCWGVEGTMAVIYVEFVIQSSIIVVVILAYRMILFWLPRLLEFSLAAYFQHSKDRI